MGTTSQISQFPVDFSFNPGMKYGKIVLQASARA
jgi:hypothetical protein